MPVHNNMKKSRSKVANRGKEQTYNAGTDRPEHLDEQERCDVAGITKSYLDLSSLHGVKYVSESNRCLVERIIWIILFSMGMIFASYFILSLWKKWEESPTFMSVESASHHVGNIPFPAVSVCSISKMKRGRLNQAIKELVKKYNLTDEKRGIKGFTNEMKIILASMIRYDSIEEHVLKKINATRGDRKKATTEDIIKLMRSVCRLSINETNLCSDENNFLSI